MRVYRPERSPATREPGSAPTAREHMSAMSNNCAPSSEPIPESRRLLHSSRRHCTQHPRHISEPASHGPCARARTEPPTSVCSNATEPEAAAAPPPPLLARLLLPAEPLCRTCRPSARCSWYFLSNFRSSTPRPSPTTQGPAPARRRRGRRQRRRAPTSFAWETARRSEQRVRRFLQ
eukprot:745799-Prymnesium_polylepis.1